MIFRAENAVPCFKNVMLMLPLRSQAILRLYKDDEDVRTFQTIKQFKILSQQKTRQPLLLPNN